MDISERKKQVLQHINDYRLSTPEAVREMVLPDETENVVTKLTSEMCKARLLNRHRLPANHCYFTLGPKGARLSGVSLKRIKPRGPIALTRALGTLLFCARHGRRLLTTSYLKDNFPGVFSPQLDSEHYYLDREGGDGPVRLGFIRTDFQSDVSHLVRKSRKDIARRQRIPAVAHLIEQGLFVIALITATEEKAAELRKAINRERLSCKFRTAVVPELLLVLGGPT